MASCNSMLRAVSNVSSGSPRIFHSHAPSSSNQSSLLYTPFIITANPHLKLGKTGHRRQAYVPVAAVGSLDLSQFIAEATTVIPAVLSAGVPAALLSIVQSVAPSLDAVTEENLATAAIVAPFAAWYLLATPGSLVGLLDLLTAQLSKGRFKRYIAEDVEVGKVLGEGSFGVVHEGFIKSSKGKQHVVLKKVKNRVEGALEMRDAELLMNHRLSRAAPQAIADFIGTVDVPSRHSHGRLSEGRWLVWRHQGERTLDFFLKQRNFPENVAQAVLGDKAPKAPGSSKSALLVRDTAVIRELFAQVLRNLREVHRTGIVHRDVKPLNLVLDNESGTLKLIDLGACADLRTGANYVPEETVMDPTYAAPEHYVMPTSTLAPSPSPLFVLASPFIWLLHSPDRFDMYSAGLVMLQLCFKPLRSEQALQGFNSEFKKAGYDLEKWRRRCRWADSEFALLDARDGAGWDLIQQLLQARKQVSVAASLGCRRLSAVDALNHRFFTAPLPLVVEPSSPSKVSGGSTKGRKEKEREKEPERGSRTRSEKLSQKRREKNTAKDKQDKEKEKEKEKAAKDKGRLQDAVRAGAMALSANLRLPALEAPWLTASPTSTPPASPSTASPTPSARPSLLPLAIPLGFAAGLPRMLSPAASPPLTPTPAGRGAATPSEAPRQRAGSVLVLAQRQAQRAVAAAQGGISTATLGALSLGSAYLAMEVVRSSTEASYAVGSWLMNTLGLWASVAIGFFYIVKPWLVQQQELAEIRRRRKGLPSLVAVSATTAGQGFGGSGMRTGTRLGDVEGRLREILERGRKRRLSGGAAAGLAVAVADMEHQMAALEGAIQSGRALRQEQEQLLTKMEGLLLSPRSSSAGSPVGAAAGSSPSPSPSEQWPLQFPGL